MWIMLTEKLPTSISPPKLSLFWSVPWYINIEQIEDLKTKLFRELRFYYDDNSIVEECVNKFFKKHENDDFFYDGRYKRPNDIKSRKIHYKGEDIKVFPHEFVIIPNKKMKLYTENTHILMADTVAEEAFLTEILHGELKSIFDSARVNGCTDAQAYLVALGIDITLPDPEFPAIGWYRCNEEFAKYYCIDEE